MANVLNKQTLRYLRSVNTPDYPTSEWLINPDISAVVGVPPQYWKLDGETVLPMSTAEMDAYDATVATTNNDLEAEALYEDPLFRRLVTLVFKENNTLRQAAGLPVRTKAQFKQFLKDN